MKKYITEKYELAAAYFFLCLFSLLLFFLLCFAIFLLFFFLPQGIVHSYDNINNLI